MTIKKPLYVSGENEIPKSGNSKRAHGFLTSGLDGKVTQGMKNITKQHKETCSLLHTQTQGRKIYL